MNEPQFIEVPNKFGYEGCCECYFYFDCFKMCRVKAGHHWELNPKYKGK